MDDNHQKSSQTNKTNTINMEKMSSYYLFAFKALS